MTRAARIISLGALAVLVGLGMGALAARTARFAASGLQMDFAGFYTAGQSLDAGLSPYENYVRREPPIWDGVASFPHSRFLHPPQAAEIARAVTVVPYRTAKIVWSVLTLACVAASLALAVRAVGGAVSVFRGLVLAGLFATFFPLRALLERGQLDGVALALLVAAISLLVSGRSALVAGLLLAIAAILKLPVLFLVPFLAVRRRWGVLAGFGLSLLGAIALSVFIEGSARTREWLRELPRISASGEEGPPGTRLPQSVLEHRREGLGPGLTRKDGVVYTISLLGFIGNATLVKTPIADPVRALLGERATRGLVSAILFAVLFACAHAILYVARTPMRRLPAREDFAYWMAALAIILLTGPMTWTMGVVWILPAGAVVSWSGVRESKALLIATVVLCVGLGIAAAPEHAPLEALTKGFPIWTNEAKYVEGEVLVLLGLLGLIALAPSGSTTPERRT